jgi:dipeptidyl-peptidase 4
MKRFGLTLLAGIMIFAIHAQTSQQLTLEDIFTRGTFPDGTFRAETVRGLRSMNDGEHYTTLDGRTRIIKNSYKTGQMTEVLFDLSKVDRAPISSFSDYAFSEDETKILLTTDKKPIYRHSYTAQYYIWNAVTRELTPLSEKEGAQQMATFSPDGDRVAFVRDNNLFIKNLRFGSETQITWDGRKNEIINGLPDWVYEEEFGFNKAFWWSPDSKFLAFIRFDETEVPEFSMTMYAGENPRIAENSPYPRQVTFKYPKAGETNSTVSVMSYELHSKLAIKVDIGSNSDIYIPRLNWTPDSKDLVVMRLNRRQNQLDVLYANPFTGETRPIFTEKNERYIAKDFLDAFVYLDDGRFVVTSERDGWLHLYLYDRLGFQQAQLTKGEFDVTDFYGYDVSQRVFYYQAAAESPLRREVYFTSQDGKKRGKVSTLDGTNHADFSKNFNYYVNYYSSNETPLQVTLHDRRHRLIRTLQDNTLLKNKLQNYTLPKKEFFTFSTSEGITLNGYMIKPADFSESKKFPVLITQYSGPNSQEVKDSWENIGWRHYLAQEGFIVVSVDPRGTTARGEDFRKATYLQLGRYESDDMVETARHLGSLAFVDKANMGIFGWSYGGFMSLLSLQKGGELFKAGIAVAPVTNWRFYDTIYTERFMRTPRENPDGYDDNSPLTHAGDIRGRLLLVHGSADDNVHVQNTYEFAEKLVQAGVQFDMAIYTNRNHGIRGGNTSMHLYTKMTNFLKEQLQ